MSTRLTPAGFKEGNDQAAMFDVGFRGESTLPSAQKRTPYRASRQGSRSRQRVRADAGGPLAPVNFGSGGGGSLGDSGGGGFLPFTNRDGSHSRSQMRRRDGSVSRGSTRYKASQGLAQSGQGMLTDSRGSASTGNFHGKGGFGHRPTSDAGGAGASLLGNGTTPYQSAAAAGLRRHRNPSPRKPHALPSIDGGGRSASSHGMTRRHRHNHAAAAGVGTVELVTRTEKAKHAGVFSIQGLKPGHANWSNQDNFLLAENFDGDSSRHLWIVLDGHGEAGHHVSKMCRERMGAIWKEHKFASPPTFRTMQAELDSAPFDVKCAGATCVMVALHGPRLELSNCGDSRAVLGRKQGTAISAVHLTVDHKPDRPDERRRVMQAGGQVGCRQLVVGHNANGPITLPLGPARVWYQNRNETMGLAMSRSLGDAIVHKLGVSAEPEITDRNLDENDCFLVIATDGIWDVIDSNQAVQIVSTHLNRAAAAAGCSINQWFAWDAQDAATVLATTARRRWEAASPMVDDITAIVVDLRSTQSGLKPPGSSAGLRERPAASVLPRHPTPQPAKATFGGASSGSRLGGH